MKLQRLFAFKQSCKNCPFLKGTGIVLSEGRLESIKNDLLADDMGWLLLKRRSNIAMRLGHAMGYIDLNELETITDLIR